MNNEKFKEIFYKNSKTFSLASKFFDERLFINISKLYYVCRCIDDIADNVKETINPEQELTNLQIDFDKNNINNDIVSIFYSIENKVNKKHILKLIDGVKSDINFTPYETIDQLLNYCHKVAGIVGIMFCEILGIDDKNALIKANDLGIAMQLTNIMRDIFEDANMGRVYLPHELFGRINPYDINIQNKDVVDNIYSEKLDQIYNIAETKYLSNNQIFNDDIESLIEESLLKDPANVRALILKGLKQTLDENYKDALKSWSIAFEYSDDADQKRIIMAGMSKALKQLKSLED